MTPEALLARALPSLVSELLEAQAEGHTPRTIVALLAELSTWSALLDHLLGRPAVDVAHRLAPRGKLCGYLERDAARRLLAVFAADLVPELDQPCDPRVFPCAVFASGGVRLFTVEPVVLAPGSEALS